MKFVARFLLTALLPILLEACASTMPPPLLRPEVEIFRVGELEIRLYQDQEKMARELPQSLALFDALRVGNKRLRVLGYYDEPNRRIYSINDARVLLHEIKHYLEPHWRHEVASDYLQVLE
jgi:hypothetical protein